jgi:hypothetical protein
MSGADNQTIEDEQRYRASAYALLAGLLRAAPDQALLDYVSGLSPDGDDQTDADALSLAMSSLAEASRGRDLDLLEQESIGESSVMVAVADNDEKNLLVSLLVRLKLLVLQ